MALDGALAALSPTSPTVSEVLFGHPPPAPCGRRSPPDLYGKDGTQEMTPCASSRLVSLPFRSCPSCRWRWRSAWAVERFVAAATDACPTRDVRGRQIGRWTSSGNASLEVRSTGPNSTSGGAFSKSGCSGFFSIGALRSSPSVTPFRRSSLSQGPCFSPRSTSWPPHDGVRRAGGTISRTSSPEAGGNSRYDELARPAVPAGHPSAGRRISLSSPVR